MTRGEKTKGVDAKTNFVGLRNHFDDAKAKRFSSPRPSRAFTLAEVLITLGIIGVVAAMTIPTLIRNSEDAELHSQLKSFVSNFSQASKLVALENGSTLNGYASMNDLATAYLDYLKVTKFCDSSLSAQGCWAYNCDTYAGSSCNPSYPFLYYRDGSKVTSGDYASMFDYGGDEGYVLLDGTNMRFRYFYDNSADKLKSVVFVDVNGYKKPNTVGRDVYQFFLMDDGRFFPAGTNFGSGDGYKTDRRYSSANSCTGVWNSEFLTHTDWGCASFVMLNKALPAVSH